LLRSAWPFAAITLALAVSYRADAIILSTVVSTERIGEYAVAYNLVFTCMALSHSINLALFPAMTRRHASEPGRSPDMFRQGFRYLAFISLPVAAFVSLNAREIVVFLYGEELSGAARPLAVVIWAVPLMFLSEFLGYVAIVLDRERLVARANWIASLGNIGANLALIPVFGVMAAAVTTVLTELLLVGQFLFALRRAGILEDRWQTMGRTFVAVLALSGATLLLHAVGLPVVLSGGLAAVTYLGIALAVRALGREELQVATALIRRG
jgi:O-antigen/teichoic acid export membrane protein